MQKSAPIINGFQHPVLLLALVCALLILSGCGDDEIEVYEAPRLAVDASQTNPAHNDSTDHDHAAHAQEAPAQQPRSQAQSPKPLKVNFTLPQGWQEAESGNMILHRLTTPSQATVAISAFPGEVGGVVPNVNRWRGQLGLPPETKEQITSDLKPVKLDTHQAFRVDLANDTQRLVVVFGMIDGKTWFFKFTGTTDQINQELTAFNTFLASVNWPQSGCCPSPGVEK